jgi:hypothetical protein
LAGSVPGRMAHFTCTLTFATLCRDGRRIGLKEFSQLGKDAEGFYFLCYGPDLLSIRTDLNKALSTVDSPRFVQLVDVHSRQRPCIVVKGKIEQLEKLRMYLATNERYAIR